MLKATIPVVAILLLVPAPSTQVPCGAARGHRAPAVAGEHERPLAGAVGRRRDARGADPVQAADRRGGPFREWRLRGRLAARQPGLTRITELRDYAAYYTAASQLRLSRSADARARFHALRERKPQGALSVSAALGEAEAAEALGDSKAAVDIYAGLADSKTTVNEDILSRLARAYLAAGEKKKAADTYLRVYYEFPLSDASIAADAQLDLLRDEISRTVGKLDIGRAQILYGARRYPEARAAFASIQGKLSGDDCELVDLRIAECDFFLKRYAATRDGVQPYLESASRKAEARFFALSAQRELGKDEEFIAATRRLVDEFPDSSWSEEALNNLATYYILTNDDELAAKTFREMYEKFPNGPRAERAAWKYGWYQYKTGEYAETARVFESAAAVFARSDYRPSFLYWAARAHGKLGNGSSSADRLRIVQADYGNWYYGRLANQLLASRADQARGRGGAR